MPTNERLERLATLPSLSELPTDALLRPEHVALYLDTDVRRLANERHSRRGPPFLKLGSSVRYRVRDLISFLEGAGS